MENKKLGLKALMIISMFASALTLSSCSRTEKTLAGVGIGAATGGIIGGAAGGGAGAAVGIAGGAVAGGLIGHSMGDDD